MEKAYRFVCQKKGREFQAIGHKRRVFKKRRGKENIPKEIIEPRKRNWGNRIGKKRKRTLRKIQILSCQEEPLSVKKKRAAPGSQTRPSSEGHRKSDQRLVIHMGQEETSN